MPKSTAVPGRVIILLPATTAADSTFLPGRREGLAEPAERPDVELHLKAGRTAELRSM
jgi:hypothetical protein